MFGFVQVLALAAVGSSYILPAMTASVPLFKTRAAAALPANCDRYYAVNSGDTCNSISAAQHVSTYQLAAVNNGTIDADCDNLAAGEVLCLGLTDDDCDVTYVIVSGDSCPSIAAAAGIPESTLLYNNPNIAAGCTNIYPGEVLCTANQTYAPF